MRSVPLLSFVDHIIISPSSSTSSMIASNSSLEGFCPSILITVPSSLVLMSPPPSVSNMSKAALNSGWQAKQLQFGRVEENIISVFCALYKWRTDLQSSPQSGRSGHHFGRQLAEESWKKKEGKGSGGGMRGEREGWAESLLFLSGGFTCSSRMKLTTNRVPLHGAGLLAFTHYTSAVPQKLFLFLNKFKMRNKGQSDWIFTRIRA